MDRLDREAFVRIMKDWKIWLSVIMFFVTVNSQNACNFFIPTILEEMGFTASAVQVHTILVWTVATIIAITVSWLSNRLQHRYAFIMFAVLLGSIGFVILLYRENVSVGIRYMSLFFVVTAGSINQILSIAWILNNVSGHISAPLLLVFKLASAMQAAWFQVIYFSIRKLRSGQPDMARASTYFCSVVWRPRL